MHNLIYRLRAVLKSGVCSFVALTPSCRVALWCARLFLWLRLPTLAALFARRLMRMEEHDFSSVSLPERTPSMGSAPEISVIIPTLNRADSLARLLEALQMQTLPKDRFEVIVVNNSSTDHTTEVCERFAPRFGRFQVINEQTPGLLAGRHAGWRAAGADVLTFCDDDIEPTPLWLETVVGVFSSHAGVVIVGGNCLGGYETQPPDWLESLWYRTGSYRVCGYYSLLEGITLPIDGADPAVIFGCNFSVRRELLESARGFGPDSMESMVFRGDGEDRVSNAAPQLGKAFLHPDASVVHHIPATRLQTDYLKRRGAHGGVDISYRYFRYSSRSELLRYRISSNGTKTESLRVYHTALHEAKHQYLAALLSSKALRAWVMQPSYLGCEAPPLEALDVSGPLGMTHGCSAIRSSSGT